jgi:predicted GNAT family acetyltransferase
MYQYIPYIILIVVIILVCIIAYIKIKFQFWTLQPVFHVYDLNYYLFPCGVIDHELPEKNKYCNFTNIETVKYDSVSELNINKFVRFIRENYLKNAENCYLPKKINIMSYFEGHNASCFFSFYYEDELLMNLKKGTTVPTKKLVGVMTTRTLNIVINSAKHSNKRDANFAVYYVDHLCVDKMYRKKGIAPQIIQTHHYNQRHHNREIVVSLFKREDELTGIVPLCVYSTYGFDMAGWNKPIDLLTIVECGKSNIHHLFDFMRENTALKFDICIQPEITNIMELIRSKNIYIYMIIEDGEVKSAYFYRKSCTFIKENCEALSCFASINCFSKKEQDIFIHGYKVALWSICEKNGFKFAVVEETSDNYLIVNALKMKTKPSFVSPTAYFFYNFAYHTFKPRKCLILH